MTRFSRSGRQALVTGGAGLIGSHLVDLLLHEGWSVRIFDALEPQTHQDGKPAWIPTAAQFVQGDMRDPDMLRTALDDIDVVFHQAAYGGYMPDISKYMHVNSVGTAHLLEQIRDHNLPVKKVIVASSQAVYREGAALCGVHGLVFPTPRPLAQLHMGDFTVHCPHCDAHTTSVPTPEHAPISGETVYAISKVDQEQLVLMWGRQTGIPTVALRYSCTYGPRQSIFNPYTGVIAIFSTRLLNGLQPVLYEDGLQTRDMCYVEDVARANLLAATTDELDGLPVNIGSGQGTTVRALAELLADALNVPSAPVVNGEFRPGEMRHLVSNITRAQTAGYAPQVSLTDGVARYLDWIGMQGDVREYFSAAEHQLRARRIVQAVHSHTQAHS